MVLTVASPSAPVFTLASVVQKLDCFFTKKESNKSEVESIHRGVESSPHLLYEPKAPFIAQFTFPMVERSASYTDFYSSETLICICCVATPTILQCDPGKRSQIPQRQVFSDGQKMLKG